MLHEIMALSEKMPDEPTIDEISEDANLPATKRDIAVVRQEIRNSVTDLRTEMKDMREGLRSEMKEMSDGLRSEMKEMKDEILHHFDVAVENIEDSLRGANADEISLMKNNLKNHKERLDVIEERVGLR